MKNATRLSKIPATCKNKAMGMSATEHRPCNANGTFQEAGYLQFATVSAAGSCAVCQKPAV